jgi:hypothetical protein
MAWLFTPPKQAIGVVGRDSVRIDIEPGSWSEFQSSTGEDWCSFIRDEGRVVAPRWQVVRLILDDEHTEVKATEAAGVKATPAPQPAGRERAFELGIGLTINWLGQFLIRLRYRSRQPHQRTPHSKPGAMTSAWRAPDDCHPRWWIDYTTQYKPDPRP